MRPFRPARTRSPVPDMSSADAKRLYQQALGDAVDDARAHAEALAKATGRTLGAITTIAEGGRQPVPIYRRRRRRRFDADRRRPAGDDRDGDRHVRAALSAQQSK